MNECVFSEKCLTKATNIKDVEDVEKVKKHMHQFLPPTHVKVFPKHKESSILTCDNCKKFITSDYHNKTVVVFLWEGL